MQRLIGIETEYGLLVEGRGAEDQVAEAMEVVRAFPRPCSTGWEYRFESPRADARGFTAASLQFDPIDAEFDKKHPLDMSANEIRSDRVLTNGARFYNDHGHPEYATPECHSLLDLVAHDCAGERLALEAARCYESHTGRPTRVYKNNTDHQGASYGTHENYLARRSTAFADFADVLPHFLASRIVFAGAGKVGANGGEPAFQLSQRAHVFAQAIGIDTLYRRPLMNTRDEPHADPSRWRRIHVIAGDANRMQFATALKMGTTLLALDLIEDGWSPPVKYRDPVRAIAEISSDDTYRWQAAADGGAIGALDMQRQFLGEAARRYQGRGPQTDWVLGEWAETLDGLERDPMELADRLDWPAKLQVLRLYMDAEGMDWFSDGVVSVDLEYHNVDPEEGLFGALAQRELVPDERIKAATSVPPSDTRAAIRGLAVERLGDALESASWSSLSIRTEAGLAHVDLRSLMGEAVRELTELLHAAAGPEEFATILQRGVK